MYEFATEMPAHGHREVRKLCHWPRTIDSSGVDNMKCHANQTNISDA